MNAVSESNRLDNAASRTRATRRQLGVFALALAVYAALVAATYLWIPVEQLDPTGSLAQIPPRWQIAGVGVAMVLVAYGSLGLAGYWCARRLGLPGIFREGAGRRAWLIGPLAVGLAMGALLVVVDQLFAATGRMGGAMVHPAFPLSIIASAAAGIGEEVLFRMFVMGLWAFLLNLLLKRRRWGVAGSGAGGATNAALWAGNVIGALAFSAGHLPGAMALAGVSTPAALPPLLLAEGLILNSALGIVAGEAYRRTGLVAAAGVHFWADIVWHVVWPLLVP